jgi:hypothetical protein
MRLVGRAGAFVIAAMMGALFGVMRANSEEAPRPPEGPVNSLRDLFMALEACWEPPKLGEAYRGLQMTVRFSFKRSGELMAPPRVTYTSEVDPEGRRIYGQSIDAMFERCTPIPFSKEMAGAIAGRPISVRFIYDRLDDSNSHAPRYQ